MMVYTPIFVPTRNKYTFTMQREWDELAKRVSSTTGNIVEIGCNKGRTTFLFGSNFPDRTIYAVDYHTVDYHAADLTMPKEQFWQQDENGKLTMPTADYIAEEAKHLSNVKVINANSQTYDFSNFKDVTFFFIDADHSYSGVKADVTNAIAYLKANRGGFISCHDYRIDPRHPWIKVREFIDSEIKPHYDVVNPYKTAVATFEIPPNKENHT